MPGSKEAKQRGRIETGVVTFGSDWPGLFLRGADALSYGHYLQQVLDYVESVRSKDLQPGEDAAVSVHHMQGLVHYLNSVHTARKTPPQQLKTARECLSGVPTLPGPAPELNPWTDETWMGESEPPKDSCE